MSNNHPEQRDKRRSGLVGISMPDAANKSSRITEILESGRGIIKNMTISSSSGERVVAVIISATTDELGALTGKLGMVPGVKVKSVLF